TEEQIDVYLSSVQDQLEGLRQALRQDAELYELARRPLMLSIFTLAYQGSAVVDLPAESTHEQILRTVFSHYVKRMLTRRGQLQRWTKEQFPDWLIYIAKQLRRHQQTVFSVESLQPDWLQDAQPRWYQWSVGLVVGLTAGLAVGIGIGQVAGLGIMLVAGLVVGVDTAGCLPEEKAMKQVWNGLVAGLATLLVAGL